MSKIPARYQRALSEMASGGILYVYIANGELCKRPAKIGSGVIVGGDNSRISVTVGTVNYLTKKWTGWNHELKASVLRTDLIERARMIGAGRDIIVI